MLTLNILFKLIISLIHDKLLKDALNLKTKRYFEDANLVDKELAPMPNNKLRDFKTKYKILSLIIQQEKEEIMYISLMK